MHDSMRQAFIERRRQLNPDQIKHYSGQIVARCQALPELIQSQHVLLYHACGGEVDVSSLTTWAWGQGKRCYLPVITDYKNNQMGFYEVTAQSVLQPNRFGIAEPSVDEPPLPADEACCVIVPLVAFQADCHRLGMGGGYYDRWLAAHGQFASSVGVAYDFQFCEDVGVASWDQALSKVVTPHRIYVR